MADYQVGDAVRLSAAFRAATITYTADGVPSVALALADPTTVELELSSPSGVTTTYTYPATISKASTGIYYVEPVTWDEAGEWRAKWTGTGNVAQVESAAYVVADRWAA